MRVRVAHSSVLNKSNASADSASSTTLLTHGKSQTVAMNAAKLRQVELWQVENCDLRSSLGRQELFSLEHLVRNVNACRNW